MTPAQVSTLSGTLLGAGVGYTVAKNPDKVGDWIVTCDPGGAFDNTQVAAVEAQIGIKSPISGTVRFL